MPSTSPFYRMARRRYRGEIFPQEFAPIFHRLEGHEGGHPVAVPAHIELGIGPPVGPGVKNAPLRIHADGDGVVDERVAGPEADFQPVGHLGSAGGFYFLGNVSSLGRVEADDLGRLFSGRGFVLAGMDVCQQKKEEEAGESWIYVSMFCEANILKATD